MKGRLPYLSMGLVLLLAACHGTRPMAVIRSHDLPAKGPAQLLGALAANDTGATAYYRAKAEVSMRSATGKRSFKAHLRLVRDSAAWVSVTPALGIEVARAMLTADSLKVIDKIHDTYWVGDTAQAHLRFGMQPSLELFQNALLGLPFGLDPGEKYRSGREDGMYTLTSREKRKFIRAAEDLAPGDTLPDDKDMREKRLARTLRKAERKEAIVYKYWIDPHDMRVSRVLISDLAHDQQADVRYMERTIVGGRSIPTMVTLSLSAPGQEASGTLRLDRIELNGPLKLYFRIPEKFKPMD